MTRLRTALVTPLTGPLVRFGRESATALSLWAEHAADLTPPLTGVHLDMLDARTPRPPCVPQSRAARTCFLDRMGAARWSRQLA
jgi:hypothetical protein